MLKAFAHVCIGAKDLVAAEKFYVDVLGCSKKFTFRNKSNELVGFYFQVGENGFIEVFKQEECALTDASPIRHLCLETDDINADVARLRSKGIEVTDVAMGCDNSYQAWFKDPNGVPIEFHQYTPKSSQYTGADCIF